VDRAIAVGGGVHRLIADAQAHGGLDRGVGAAAPDDGLVAVDRERRDVARRGATHQQRDRAVGGLVRPAGGLASFHRGDRGGGLGGRQLGQAEGAGSLDHRGAAGQLRHREPRGVADHRRIDVLVAGRVAQHRGDVDAALVRERAGPDVGRVVVGRQVGDVGDQPGERRQRGEIDRGGDTQLEREARDHGGQVGVAAALAVAVDRALHVGGASPHGGQRVGSGAAAVVVGVDADPRPHRPEVIAGGPHRGVDLPWQRAAGGVAQDDGLGAGARRGGEGRQRVGGVGGEAGGEVLGVVDDPAAGGAQERDGVGDHLQVVVGRRAEDLDRLEPRRLTEDGADRCRRVDQRHQAGVVGARPIDPAGGAERAQRGPAQRLAAQPGEQLGVLGVRAGPPGLDERHAERVERAGDAQLVGDRVRDAGALAAVAQGRVVDLDGGGHGAPSRARSHAAIAGRRACR
jgi:hypothetical protein